MNKLYPLDEVRSELEKITIRHLDSVIDILIRKENETN